MWLTHSRGTKEGITEVILVVLRWSTVTLILRCCFRRLAAGIISRGWEIMP